jgi:hypothetical protein
VPIQGGKRIICAMSGQDIILARRFSLVVLVVAIFGMAFAVVVAETARPANSVERYTATSCALRDGWVCVRR